MSKPKASGASIPESQRHTVKLTLRVSPQFADAVRARARAESRTIADIMVTSYETLSRYMLDGDE